VSRAHRTAGRTSPAHSEVRTSAPFALRRLRRGAGTKSIVTRIPNTRASFCSMSSRGSASPRSIRAIDGCFVPICAATSA